LRSQPTSDELLGQNMLTLNKWIVVFDRIACGSWNTDKKSIWSGH